MCKVTVIQNLFLTFSQLQQFKCHSTEKIMHIDSMGSLREEAVTYAKEKKNQVG